MKPFSRILLVVFTIAFGIGMPGTIFAATTTVDLGTAAPFAILAGTPNITDAGNTSVITGNVGLSPATGAGIGLTAAQVTGTIYAVDAAGPVGSVNDPARLTAAKQDLTDAWIDAAGRTPVTTVPTELGGTTKTAGVYNSASTTFGITAGAGPLILDGQGDSSAVFIFEMAADGTGLTVGPGSTVSLINSASACNVFWRLNTATIDTTAVFKGNILALTSITVANGANIEGRLLARNGNVTLINDTITVPTCAATSPTTPADSAAATSATSATSDTSATGLPSTGIAPDRNGTPWNIVIPTGILAVLTLLSIARKKRTN